MKFEQAHFERERLLHVGVQQPLRLLQRLQIFLRLARREAARNGLIENPVTASAENRSIRPRLYFVFPAVRAWRSYGTATCAYPIQATIPRMKREVSGRRRKASTARRLIRRKSPVSGGIETSARYPISR